MATTYTDNLNLQQPDLDDDALITVINNDMAIIDKAVNGVQDGLAIVANGNTHVAISAGQFVYVRNHTTLTEGLYVASSNIAANATLSTSNLTADSAGGLNALNGNIALNTETLADGIILFKIGRLRVINFSNGSGVIPTTGISIGEQNIAKSFGKVRFNYNASNTNGWVFVDLGRLYASYGDDSENPIQASYVWGTLVYFV